MWGGMGWFPRQLSLPLPRAKLCNRLWLKAVKALRIFTPRLALLNPPPRRGNQSGARGASGLSTGNPAPVSAPAPPAPDRPNSALGNKHFHFLGSLFFSRCGVPRRAQATPYCPDWLDLFTLAQEPGS